MYHFVTRCVSSSLSVAAFETAKGLFFFSQRPEEEEEERERKEEEGGRKLFLSLSRTRRSTRNKAAGVRCSSSS